MKTDRLKVFGIVLLALLVGIPGVYGFQNWLLKAGILDQSGSEFGFSELNEFDRERISAQRRLVLEEAQRRYGTTAFFRDERDLRVLQRLIDDRVFAPVQTYELQSLGIVFGDVFDGRAEFDWKIVADEYGRDPTLRYKSSSAHLNALTMLSKRIERSEAVDVMRLFDETIDYFAANDLEIAR